MDLYKEQEKLQQDSYNLLKKRIEELTNNKSSHLQTFAKAKGLLVYIKKFIEVVDKFMVEYLQQVIGKVIQQDNNHYAKLLEVEYKNIHDAIAKPLAWSMLDKSKISKTVDFISSSKTDFKTKEKNHLKKLVQKVIDDLYKHISIGADYYSDLANEPNRLFKENPQRVALAVWQLNSNEIVNTVVVYLLSLQQKDNADNENSANSRQSFGGDIGVAIHELIAKKYFRDIEKLKDNELKSAYREYQNDNFEELEQLSKPILSEKVELEIGQKMLDLALEVKIIKEYTKPNDEKNFNYLKLNSELLEKMNSTDKQIAYGASMIYKPMVIEPLDWDGMYGGGFLSDKNIESRFELSLIKASNKKDRKALQGKVIPKTILEAVNNLQHTPFKINTKILNVLLDYHSDINYMKKRNRVDFAYYRILREILSANLYNQTQKEIEKHFKNTKYIKVKDYKLYETDKKRIKKALKEIEKSKEIETFRLDSEIYYEIAKYKQGFDTIIQIADEMKRFKQFYFVWRMDFRGRLYPQQTLLHPQAGDMPKSLLLFATEKPLDKSGKEWFLIHGANCYGEVDKEIFSKRIEWVKEHHNIILSCAKDYRSENFWKRAGDPFKFLAWCFEYERYIKNPETFTTAIPIAIDGSNNGFQHITALLRDTKGAKKVNVLPSYDKDGKLKMSDFYAEVAIELKSLVSKEIEKFEKKKEKLIEKDGLFYKEEEKEIFEPYYHLETISKYLEEIDENSLKPLQYYTSYLFENFSKEMNFNIKELDKIEKTVQTIERKVRKKVGDNDLEEIKLSIIDEFYPLIQKAKRAERRGNIFLKRGKAFSRKKELKLEASSLYSRFIDKDLINRSFVKSPVMTESYGSSTEGKAKALLDKIESKGVLSDLDEDSRYLVAFEITKLLEDALSLVSSSPAKYKRWMKRYASDIVKTDHPIIWKTPLGLEVKQVDFQAKRVKVSIANGRKVEFKTFTDKLDKTAHKKGLAPNFIHSLDASHLMMSVNALAKRGISDIVTVHDSFATHANDVGVLSITLREAFIALHQKEILKELTDFWQECFEIKQKKISYVDKDNFDLNEILKSDYFFA